MNSQYSAFITAARLKSISKTAERLGYTQSGVSKQLKTLEKEWGINLFIRTQYGVELTNEGRMLLPYIEKVANDEDMLAEQLCNLKSKGGGSLSIGTFNSISFTWLPAILEHFNELCPNTNVTMVHGNYARIERALLEEQVHCGFVSIPTHESLKAWPLVRDRMLVILPKDHPLAGRSQLQPLDLTGEEFIIPPEGLNYTVGKAFAEAGFSLRSKAIVDEDYSVLLMVKKGFGITVLPEGVFNTLAIDGIVAVPFGDIYRTLGIAVKNTTHLTGPVYAFIQACRDVISYSPACDTDVLK